MTNDRTVARRALVGAVSVLLLMLLVAAATAFPFQFMRISGNAMEPALKDRQRLIVNKLIYRLRAPQAGEVVMIYSPIEPTRLLVQRVIAREGDTVQIVRGNVSINGKPLSEEQVAPAFKGHDDWGPQVVPTG